MGARRSLVPVLSVLLIAPLIAVALVLPNISYTSPQTFTYHVAIQRGANTTLTITNHTILLMIAYNESYGSASGTLMKNFFIASSGRVYISFVPTFCEARPTPIPLDKATPSALIKPAVHLTTLGVSHLIILPPPLPPLPPPSPVQKSVGSINLTISFIPVTPTSRPVNITVQILPCTLSTSTATLLPGYYNVTAEFVWVLPGEFYGLNGTLGINVVHINVITPAPPTQH